MELLESPQKSNEAHPLPVEETQKESYPIDPTALSKLFGKKQIKQAEYLKKFARHGAESLKEIDVAFADNDNNQIAFIAHKLKSSAGMVGATSLASTCEQLEKIATEGDQSRIKPLISQLHSQYDDVKTYIDTL
ncbi:hypothetical protein BOW53_12345 [Solemya pervernicosa gill symbiont]|uniref:HPt domain-containing protein n=1 Tax=Solemya pervernicosa gill symbiont TaxID=642797 RepID=A0A1T2L2E7_9GAMM|nr:Hpt domain-containing protein [Solemya pervernicosa gill symbiont]OOZ39244.1 hypothetical protein BOW53_12345 [Solemya pervernicosa gill symbiont]